jgi:NADH-quinone oxidoreductase subunit L
MDPVFITAVSTAFAPFAAFLFIVFFARRDPLLSSRVSIGAIGLSTAGAGILLLSFHEPVLYASEWLTSGDSSILFGFLLDPVSLLMLAVVTLICLMVQVYSLGYMAGDPGFWRYFAFMSLFAGAMISLTISSSLLQLFVFWELVGLSSYLLIGFWYEKFSATQAGKKAFVMTRLGDTAFFLGILLLLIHLGNLSIPEINSPGAAERLSPAMVTLCSVLIFGGIIGKSAQFPLLTWLPDAMEGPTPVSALLHSATMVAAGVFLFARLFPFLSRSETALSFFLAVGTVSMLLPATMAMVSRDVKQVWAYSTISQLGLMIMGLAAGNAFTGLFHLAAHAGFKALLFLCSGVFIHAFATNDMFEIGQRGGRKMKVSTVCLVIAAAALAGVPPMSGFFSKERIIEALSHLSNPVWLLAGLLGIFLTAYYSFRLIFIILFPRVPSTGSPDAGHHSEHPVMTAPLIVLAAATVLLGFFAGPLESFIGDGSAAAEAEAQASGWILIASLLLSAAGILTAWLEFGRRGAAQAGWAERIPALRSLFAQRWYLDHFYRFLLDYGLYRGLTRLCARNEEEVIDRGIHALSRGTVEAGGIMSLLHTGMIQYRLLTIFAVLVFLAIFFVF